MKYEVVDKDEFVPAARRGQAAELYKDLYVLMQDAPNKKLIVDFGTVHSGYKVQCKLAEWAGEDGLQLFASAVHGTGKRELFLQKVEVPA